MLFKLIGNFQVWNLISEFICCIQNEAKASSNFYLPLRNCIEMKLHSVDTEAEIDFCWSLEIEQVYTIQFYIQWSICCLIPNHIINSIEL